MLGLRTSVRADTEASPADFAFGTSLLIPGEFCAFDGSEADQRVFLDEFRSYIRKVKTCPVTHKQAMKHFTLKDLKTCTHVFYTNKAIKPLLRPTACAQLGRKKQIEQCTSQAPTSERSELG